MTIDSAIILRFQGANVCIGYTKIWKVRTNSIVDYSPPLEDPQSWGYFTLFYSSQCTHVVVHQCMFDSYLSITTLQDEGQATVNCWKYNDINVQNGTYPLFLVEKSVIVITMNVTSPTGIEDTTAMLKAIGVCSKLLAVTNTECRLQTREFKTL